jgi:hypothetical protein
MRLRLYSGAKALLLRWNKSADDFLRFTSTKPHSMVEWGLVQYDEVAESFQYLEEEHAQGVVVIIV